MRTRRALALLGYTGLLLFFAAASTRPGELVRRWRLLAHDANRDPTLRRLDGSSAAFDRRFFYFLESVRRSLPPHTRGLAVRGPSPGEAARNLVAYQFSPLPALLDPREVPSGWVLAVYGTSRPDGWREIARVSDGALLERNP
jgi:hypothetical protein